MFSRDVVGSDIFLDMPPSTQLLYFQFGMEADDDGFLGSPNKLIRAFGANKDELKILQAKGFVIPFQSGVVVIRHWHENNQIRADRYKETIFKDEKSQLIKGENGWYEVGIPTGNQLATVRQPSIGKGSIVEDSVVENIPAQDAGKKKRIRSKKPKSNDQGLSMPELSMDTIGDVFTLLGEVNTASARWYAMDAQKQAVQRLINRYGHDKVKKGVMWFLEHRGELFIQITTPYQLELKWDLIVQAKRNADGEIKSRKSTAEI
ncbi:hypothetical protein UFOVP594_8 [uncultured Caudovirales phage]|uniref:DNA replication protein n=1 Tax=uncultured Caudovirales phage TaxID=2100421 RepID=A0A6J5MY22_9CAUD|nr:hypothetical protein UFOVP594_8 [uncultured Caudovirales phage]